MPSPARAARQQPRRQRSRRRCPDAKPSVMSWSTNSHHTKSSSSPRARRRARARRQREAVVEARLEVERVADHARHARVGHDARRQHRVGRGQQRAEEEALGPVQVGQRVRGERDDRRRDRHRQHELAQRQAPRLLQHLGLDLEPVAEQDHDQRDDRQRPRRSPTPASNRAPQAALAEHEAGQHEERGQRQEAAPREPGQQRAAHEQRAEDEQRRSRTASTAA